MKKIAIPIIAVLALPSGMAWGQGAEDPIAQLRACSVMERADRLECLDKLSRTIVPPRPATGQNWIISQTTSPVDYSSIATARTSSRDRMDGIAMQLSIYCRGGRTELAIAGPPISGPGEDYAISYSINDGPPVQLGATASTFGVGLAFKGDSAALLQSLPNDGTLTLHLSPRAGTALTGIFSLAGLETVRAKIRAACKWPQAVAQPNK
jgi:hypothetical protein